MQLKEQTKNQYKMPAGIYKIQFPKNSNLKTKFQKLDMNNRIQTLKRHLRIQGLKKTNKNIFTTQFCFAKT